MPPTFKKKKKKNLLIKTIKAIKTGAVTIECKKIAKI